MNISNIIRSIRNIMRKDEGVDGDAQRISQMVWMLFMKIFSDSEEEWKLLRKEYKSPIPENLKWKNWATSKNGLTGEELINFINNELFPTLKNIEANETDQSAIINSIFNDTHNYMKSGNLFRQVIDEINKIKFGSTEERHVFNEIYESILKELQSAGSSGEFYTPRAVTQFMVQMVNPKLGESILDPACGTGGFLISSLEHMQEIAGNVKDMSIFQDSLKGVEKKPLPHLLCTTNLILHGIEKPSIKRGNLLSQPYESWNSKTQVDIILSNPPFGGLEEDGTETNFPERLRTKETADLFLVLIMKMLKKNGRAAVVLPDGSLYGNGIKGRIRKELLTTCNLHTIIRLPHGIFNPYTPIKTNLLFFEKGKATKDIWYYEMPLPANVKNFNKNRAININDFNLIKEWWGNKVENEFAWRINIAYLESTDYNLDIKNPVKEEAEEVDSIENLINKIEMSIDKSQRLMKIFKESFL